MAGKAPLSVLIPPEAGAASGGGGDGSFPGTMSPLLVGARTGSPKADRERRRKDLLLDDEVLLTSSLEYRQYVPAAVYAYTALVALTLGILALVMSWNAKSKLRLLTRPCSPDAADVVIVDGVDGSSEICPVEALAESAAEILHSRRACGSLCTSLYTTAAAIPLDRRMVVYRHSRFVYSAAAQAYALAVPEDFSPAPTVAGLSSEEAESRLVRSGANAIAIPIPPGIILFFKECIHPFFVFQIWAVIVSALGAAPYT
jgi:hypothetical protein